MCGITFHKEFIFDFRVSYRVAKLTKPQSPNALPQPGSAGAEQFPAMASGSLPTQARWVLPRGQARQEPSQRPAGQTHPLQGERDAKSGSSASNGPCTPRAPCATWDAAARVPPRQPVPQQRDPPGPSTVEQTAFLRGLLPARHLWQMPAPQWSFARQQTTIKRAARVA